MLKSSMQRIGIHFDPVISRAVLSNRSQIHEFQQDTKNVKRLYMTKSKAKRVTGLFSKDYLLRSVKVEATHSKHIREAISFQADGTHHLEDVLTVPLIEKKDKSTDALVFIVPKAAMENHLKEVACDPDIVSTTASALSHFVHWKKLEAPRILCIDIGSYETAVVYLEDGKLKRAHSIGIGAETLKMAFLEDKRRLLLRSEIDKAAAATDLLQLRHAAHLIEQLESLRSEISRTKRAFAKDLPCDVYVTGRTRVFINLKKAVAPEAKDTLTEQEEFFAVAIGLAMEDALQLRTAEFFPTKNFRKLGRIASLLITLSLATSAVIASLGVQLGIRPQGAIDRMRAIEANNKEFTFIPEAPRAADALSWLSTHVKPEILKACRYKLVKESGAELELELQFPNGTEARKFHDLLRTEFGDVTWDAEEESVRATFKLRGSYAF